MAYVLAGAGIAIEGLVYAGITISGAIALWFGLQKAKTELQKKALADAISKTKNQSPEIHRAWEDLDPYQGKVRRGTSSKGRMYYYQKDMLHGDVEVYKLSGSKGVHIGCVSMYGGPLTKPAVPGRTIQL